MALEWYKGDSLLNELCLIEKKYLNDEMYKPLRMTVKNLFKGTIKKKGYGVTVKIDSGILEKNDKVLLMPT